MKRFLLLAVMAATGCDLNGVKKITQLKAGKIYMIRPQHAESPIDFPVFGRRPNNGETLRYVGESRGEEYASEGGSMYVSDVRANFSVVGGSISGESMVFPAGWSYETRTQADGTRTTNRVLQEQEVVCEGGCGTDYNSRRIRFCKPEFIEVAK